MGQVIGVSALDFAYKGYQYPLPPTWKNAIRLQDQINWLLQAVLALDAAGVSVDDMTAAISDAVSQMRAETRAGDANVTQLVTTLCEALDSRISQIENYNAAFRNPVTGMRDYGYVVAKQMYDMLRTYACTWDELRNTGLTWDQLKATGHTWFEVDMLGNVYWGDGKQRVKFTPTADIDVSTPGYVDMSTPGAQDAQLARSWGDMAQFGFLTRKA